MSQRITTAIGLAAGALLLAVLAGIVGILYSRPAGAQGPVGVPGMRQVTVVGRGEVSGAPDTATVQIGVETEAQAAKDALAQNNSQAQAIQAKLKELGIAEKDIQTTGFNVFPVYNQDGRQVTGYRVNNEVTVKIRDLAQAGPLLDQVVQAGANQVRGVSFSVEDPQQLLNQARERAMQDARTRAQTLAQAGSASLGEVLVISENVFTPPFPMPLGRAEAAQDAASVPVQPGEQQFSVDVQVTFALR
jgi:hypothetical protein